MDSPAKINILMVSSSSALGGGTKHMFMLGENLRGNYKIFYAIPKNNNFLKYLNSENHLEISERKIHINDLLNLINFIRFNSIDIIHAHGKGAGAISRIIKIFVNRPLIYTFHGIHLKYHSLQRRIIYIFYEYLFGWIDTKKILVSKSEKEFALQSKIYLGRKSLIINNGVSNQSIKSYSDINLFENQFEDFQKIRVISVCRFVNQKNIIEIIKIAINLPEIEFFLIGDGPLWEEINKLIFDKNIKNVYLLGKKKNIFKYLYSSDIFLTTSIYEGLSISVLEAMSIGLPIVASNVIGNIDTIKNGESGFLYELNDISMATYYLKMLANDRELIRKIGKSAFRRQRNIFSKKLMINNYINLYKNTMN